MNIGAEPWNTLLAGLAAAVVASLATFLAAVWVLRRTLVVIQADAEARQALSLVALRQQTLTLGEAQRRERTISAAAQLTSGWVTPGWEWVALDRNAFHGMPDKRRWELVRRWLADGSRLYMNLVDDELDVYYAIAKTTAVLNELIGPHSRGPEAYISTARTFSVAINEWVRGNASIEQTVEAIDAEIDRVEHSGRSERKGLELVNDQ